MTDVSVEGCKEGIFATSTSTGMKGGLVELTGCTLRGNRTDYRRGDGASSIVVDGSARPEGDS